MTPKDFFGDDGEEKHLIPQQKSTYAFGGKGYAVLWDSGYPDMTERCQKFQSIIDSAGIEAESWEIAIEKFLQGLSVHAREGIKEFLPFPDQRVISVRTTRPLEPFNKSYEIGFETGWYYYVTGIDLDVPDYIQNLDRKYGTENRFQRALKKYKELKNANGSRRDPEVLKKARQAIAPHLRVGCQIDWNEVCVWCVADKTNSHAFLLEVREPCCRILLDCGIDEQDTDAWEFLQEHPPEWIVITHTHKDHAQGWQNAAKIFPNVIFICSKTTMAYLFVDFLKRVGKKRKEDEFYSAFVNRAYCPKIGKSLKIGENGQLKFLFAGHLPGAIAILLTVEKNRFLYTGDFTWDPVFPVAGFIEVAQKIAQGGPVDWLLLDGSNGDNSRPPIDEVFQALYGRAHQTFNLGGSVAVATDPGSLGPMIFYKFFELGREIKDNFPIYVPPKILTYMRIVNHYSDDLPSDFAAPIRNRKNPFSSWRVQRIESIQDYYAALASPSLILTYPVDINEKPFNDFYPLFAQNKHNLLVFGFFARDETTLNLQEFTPREMELKTTLGQLSKEIVKVKVTPRYQMYNQEVDHFQLPTHACKEEVENLIGILQAHEVKKFHNQYNPLPALTKIFP